MKSPIIVLLSALVFQAHGACQPGFESLGENCYVILHVQASWGEALHYCQAMGASLAVIRNKQEEALIDGYIHRQHGMLRSRNEYGVILAVIIALFDPYSWGVFEIFSQDTRYWFSPGNGLKCLKHHNKYFEPNDHIRTSQLWIGGTDLLQEGIFLAPNSLETLTYFNWAPGGPDNVGTGQHCMSIFKDDALLRWDDNNCEVKNWPLCQRDQLENTIVVG